MTSNSNISVLHNPVDCSMFNADMIRRDHTRVRVVLFAGEICANKGVYDVVSAASIVRNKCQNAVYVLAGNGEIDSVLAFCQEKNTQEYVLLPGLVTGRKKIELFIKSDIFVLPSYNEGLPVAILEAMACRLPVVATRVGGIPEAIEDGVNGFLIDPGDTRMLADRILTLAKNDRLRRKMGRESLRIARKKFDMNVVVARLCRMYEELLAKNQKLTNNDE